MASLISDNPIKENIKTSSRMKNVMKVILLTLLIGLSYTVEMNAQVVVKVKPARPATVAAKPATIKSGHIWVDGHWKWNANKNKYIWVDGHWKSVKAGHEWQAGYWVAANGGHKWVPGRWVAVQKAKKRARVARRR